MLRPRSRRSQHIKPLASRKYPVSAEDAILSPLLSGWAAFHSCSCRHRSIISASMSMISMLTYLAIEMPSIIGDARSFARARGHARDRAAPKSALVPPNADSRRAYLKGRDFSAVIATKHDDAEPLMSDDAQAARYAAQRLFIQADRYRRAFFY